MPQEERAEILMALSCVDGVVITDHKINDTDTSVCNELHKLKPDIFANGGDRKQGNIPEYDLCTELGIEMIFNVGGGKIQSSSWLINNQQS